MALEKEKDLDFFTAKNTKHVFKELGAADTPVIFWGHGWGQSHHAFIPLAESLAKLGTHKVLDFPGFGASPKPQEDWSTEDYADAIAEHLKSSNAEPIIWAGHSFGCRVGIRLASKYPDLVKGLILIAGAGLKRKRHPLKSFYFKLRVYTYKFLKNVVVPLGLSKDWLQSKFGSSDYKNAGEMRGIFLKTISEDLTEASKSVKCSTLLIYGEIDTETPPEFGERYNKYIKDSKLFILSGLDHYSVLSSGRHQVANLIQDFIKTSC